MQFQLPALGIKVPNALLIMMALLAVSGVVGRETAEVYLSQPWVVEHPTTDSQIFPSAGTGSVCRTGCNSVGHHHNIAHVPKR